MTLQEALRKFKEGVLTRVSAADLKIMEGATEELVRARMAEGAKKIGDQAPDFSLPDSNGEMVRLADLLARGPVVLTFYRGVWWPYCNLQLQAYQDILPEVQALGASLVAISPQKPEYSLSMADKHKLGFEVLSDAGNRVARAYGLVFSLIEPLRDLYIQKFGVDLQQYNGDASYELPLPGTFIIAPDGIIRFAFVDPDYTLRLEPSEIIRILGEMKPNP